VRDTLNTNAWTTEENERLREMVAKNISIVRAAAIFHRNINSVRVQARKLGVPFLSIRAYRKKIEAAYEISPRN
jgi:orotate phosphoribosyltransferase